MGRSKSATLHDGPRHISLCARRNKCFHQRMNRYIHSLLVLAAGAALGADATVVFHDDFEAAAAASPPPGWTMWGSERFKIPANYTRDISNPHSGQASFRIHHPAGTGGYVVSTPDRALRPQPAMRYTVSFWARAEQPGPAQFRQGRLAARRRLQRSKRRQPVRVKPDTLCVKTILLGTRFRPLPVPAKEHSAHDASLVHRAQQAGYLWKCLDRPAVLALAQAQQGPMRFAADGGPARARGAHELVETHERRAIGGRGEQGGGDPADGRHANRHEQ